MAFDITRITDAVNRHLNSISDISSMVKQASEDVENRTRFSAELSEAIRQNFQEHMATEEFQELQSLQEVSKSFSASAESGSQTATSRELTTRELQDLSKSRYFSVNLVQNALYNSGNSDDESDGGTTDLTKSLLPGYSDNIAAALTGSTTNSAISGNVVRTLISDENAQAALYGGATNSAISGNVVRALISDENAHAALYGGATNSAISGNVVKALISDENARAALSGSDAKAVVSELLGSSDSGNDYSKALLGAYSRLNASGSGSSAFGDFLL